MVARFDILVISALVFAVMLLFVRNDSPVQTPLVDRRVIKPVKALDAPMYVINLARNTDRLKTFMNFVADSDFKDQTITRLPAIDGKSVDLEHVVSREAMPALTHTMLTDSRTSHEQLTVGAVGCYLSHMAAWKAIRDSGKPFGFVFEDDAEVGVHALRDTLAALDSLPSGWDILLLGTACLNECPRVPHTPLKKVTHFVRFHAYVVSRKACEFLCGDTSGMLPMSIQVDWKISELAAQDKVKVFTTRTFLADSGYQGTDIQRPVFR